MAFGGLPTKRHTIRANYVLWAKRIAEVEAGRAELSVREWTGAPYRSHQTEICRLSSKDGVHLQRLEFRDLGHGDGSLRVCVDGEVFCSCFNPADPLFSMRLLAMNDGLTFVDWWDWFRGYDLTKPLAIIHFTRYNYG